MKEQVLEEQVLEEQVLKRLTDKLPHRTLKEKVNLVGSLVKELSGINDTSIIIGEEYLKKAFIVINAPKELSNKIPYYIKQYKKLIVQRIATELISFYKIKCFNGSYQLYDSTLGFFNDTHHTSIQKIIKSYSKEALTSSEIKEIMSHIQIDSIIPDDGVNNHQINKLIHCKNTMIDVNNSHIKLKPHSEIYNSTCCLNAKYDLDAKCPKWLKFIDETFNHYGDEKGIAITLLQEIMGYFLIPGNNLQKGFLFYGVARSGKSLIGNIITNLLGQNNVSNIPLSELDKDTHIIELASKLLNLAGELEKGVKIKTAKIKSLIGQDKMFGRKLFSNPFYFVNPSKLLTITNHLPYFNDNSDAMLERLVVLHFATQVPEEKRNPNLLNELEKEIDGIFMWAIQGLIRLNNRKYFIQPTKNENIINNIQDISDTIIYWLDNSTLSNFENIQHMKDSTYKISLKSFYNAYKEFCKDEGVDIETKKEFRFKIKEQDNMKVYKDTSKNQEYVEITTKSMEV